MQATTLTVPAEHRETFRWAAVKEVESCGNWVDSQARELAEHITSGGPLNGSTGGVDGAFAHLTRDVEVLRAIAGADEGPLEVTSDPSTLAHIAETMARKVVGPQITDALGYGPMDESAAAGVRKHLAPLAWAIDTAERLHAEAAEAHSNGKGGTA